MTTIDCRLPHDLAKIVWGFRPYHSTYKTILKELIIKYHIDIIKKSIQIFTNYTVICRISLHIKNHEEEEISDEEINYSETIISICNVYEESNIDEYIDNEYHPNAHRYIELLRNQVYNIDYDLLTNKLVKILTKKIDNNESIEILLEVEYEGCISKFNTDKDLDKTKWISRPTHVTMAITHYTVGMIQKLILC